ncbi:MAG: hypothetical protein K9M99_12080 [Candidatus Cloacimonetes bacterium]|nr:hypothetical protein [Candidatus Cloacimonadota bacterium]
MKKYFWIWLIAVCMAVFLWLQSMLLSEQEASLLLPIIFEPQPENLSRIDLQEPEIEVILKTKGVNILLFKHQNIYYLEDGSKLKYGMNSLHLNPENIKCSPKQLEYITGFGQKVKMIEMDRIITRQKPVILTFSSATDEQFYQKQQLDVSSGIVEVKGPEKLLEKLEGIKTEAVSKRDLKNNQLRVALISPSPLIEIKFRETVLRFNSSLNAIKTISLIPIAYTGSEILTFSPQRVTAKIEGLDALISKITKEQIKVELVVPANREILYGSLKFTLPDNVKLLEYTPEKILLTRTKE